MRAMILAAGLGTRLGDLTKDIPKPMIDIGGIPLLLHTIIGLKQNGIHEIVINIHHKGEKITNFFGNGKWLGVNIKYSSEAVPRGTAGGVHNAAKLLGDEPFLVLYGDNYYQVNLARIINDHLRSDKTDTCLIGLCKTKAMPPPSVVQFDIGSMEVLRFTEKPTPEQLPKTVESYNWMFGGLMIVEPKMLRSIPEGSNADFGKNIIPQWIRFYKEIYCTLIEDAIIDIGTPQGLAAAKFAFQLSKL